MGGFKIPTKKNPNLATPKREHQGDILGKPRIPKLEPQTPPTPVGKAPQKKREKKSYKKLTLLLNDAQYAKILAMAEAEDRSMSKITIRSLVDTGFIS